MLSHGVEGTIVEMSLEPNDSGYGDAMLWSCTVVGGRIFERLQPEHNGGGNIVSLEDARWLDLGLADALSAARSPSRRCAGPPGRRPRRGARAVGSLPKGSGSGRSEKSGRT